MTDDSPDRGPSRDPYLPEDFPQDHEESGVGDQHPTPDPTPDDHDHAQVMAGAGDFTSGEGLVAFAGLVLLAVWLIFDLIIDNYGMNNTIAVLAAAAAILPRMNRETLERIHPLPVLMKLVGWAIVAFGIVEVLADVRFGVYDDFGIIVAALISYAGYAMAFMGARQIEI